MTEDRRTNSATWKKFFKVPLQTGLSPIHGSSDQSTPSYRNYQNNLPDVYIGHPNRLERYNQYESMDLDPEVNAALDVLAEFSTRPNAENGTVFALSFNETPTDNEIKIINDQLRQWNALNEFNKRIFRIFRNVIKYGDQVFVRDPENFKLYWTEMKKVLKVIVNESEGKLPEQYVIKELNINLLGLNVTAVTTSDTGSVGPQSGGTGGSGSLHSKAAYAGGSRFTHAHNESVISAEHIIHMSLTEGLDAGWPFGSSVLENVFKVFKQKELIEDALIIYRVQRAPERRVFYIDVGGMQSHMAMAFVERVKNEIHQRRIPSQTGGGENMMDATYSPLASMEDYFFPQTPDGRGSKVEVLPGGQNIGEITDLRFFTNKLFRGLRIPSSYLPTTEEDGSASVSDGKVGTALIQEWRFNQYCRRLQNLIVEKLDHEFKMFIRWRGINIDSSLFDLKFCEPQNFSNYLQADLDGAKIATYAQLEGYTYFSKRFLMQRYLGLSETEMAENDKMWKEEQGSTNTDNGDTGVGLRGVGITPGGMEADLVSLGTDELAPEAPEEAPQIGAGGAPTGLPGI